MDMAQEKKVVEVAATSDLLVVLLAKASSVNGDGAGYYPVTGARVQDLPEDLRQQIAGVMEGEASAFKEAGEEREKMVCRLDATPISLAPDNLRRLPAWVVEVSDNGQALDTSGLAKLSDNNYAGELHSSPYAVQVPVDAAVGAKPGDPIPLAPGVMAAGGSGGNLSWAVLGIVAASSAVTTLAGGGAVSPAVAFGSFLILLGGVALVMASVRTT